MSSLQTFMLRMHLLDRSSPYRPPVGRRRRFSSSASAAGDVNNNYGLSPIINPSLKRHKVPAFVYQTSCSGQEANGNVSETSPQLAVHSFDGLQIKLRSEQPMPVSIERFLSFRRFGGCAGTMGCHEDIMSVISGVYLVPRIVPVSCISTAHPCYDPDTGTSTMIYRTTVEFRRTYHPVASRTMSEEQQEVDRDPPNYVTHACWIVSDVRSN